MVSSSRDMVAVLQAHEVIPSLRDAPSMKISSNLSASVPTLKDLEPGVRVSIIKNARNSTPENMWFREYLTM
jgi:hypothetical protein